MTTDNRAVATREDNKPALIRDDQEKVKLIKQQVFGNKGTELELQFFIRVCDDRGYDPFAIPRQIWAVHRKDRSSNTETMQIQIAVDGVIKDAEESGQYLGSEIYWCAKDGVWRDVWLEDFAPSAAKAIVHFRDRPDVIRVAHWREYAQYYGNDLSPFWKKMAARMIGKCALALALRESGVRYAKPMPTPPAGVSYEVVPEIEEGMIAGPTRAQLAEPDPDKVGTIDDDSDSGNAERRFWAKMSELEMTEDDVRDAMHIYDVEGEPRKSLREAMEWWSGGWSQMIPLMEAYRKSPRYRMPKAAPMTREQLRDGARALYDHGEETLEKHEDARSQPAENMGEFREKIGAPPLGASSGEAPGDANVAPPHAGPAASRSLDNDSGHEEADPGDQGVGTQDDGSGGEPASSSPQDDGASLGTCELCGEREGEGFWGERLACQQCIDQERTKPDKADEKADTPAATSAAVPFPSDVVKNTASFKREAFQRRNIQPRQIDQALGPDWDKGVRLAELPALWDTLMEKAAQLNFALE